MKLTFSFSLFVVAASSMVSGSPAVAQTPDGLVGEVIVTARKRQEALLEVPVVATIVGAERIERVQMQDLKDLSKLAPGLSLGQSVGALGTQISLRGVGTTAINVGIDQSVALNVDGLQMTQGQAYASSVFDVAQIEVLKGPQALFYGKNSPGGVVAIRTADPTNEFEAIGRVGYEFEAREPKGELIVSGPISDSVRARLAMQYRESDGFYRNKATAVAGAGGQDPASRRGPEEQSYVIRGTMLWNPSEQFDARLKLNYTRQEIFGGYGSQFVSCPDGTAPTVGIPFLTGEDCRKNRTYRLVDMDPSAFVGAPNNGIGFGLTPLRYGTLELNYYPHPDLTITSSTGYYRQYSRTASNGTLSTGAGPGLSSFTRVPRRDFTQELRVNSEFQHPVNFTAGVYYQDAKLGNRVDLFGNMALGMPQFLGRYEQQVDIETQSLFAQLRWDISEQVEIAAGVRWTDEERELRVWNWASGAPVPFPTSVPRIKSDNLSPELTVTYQPTDMLTLFGSLKKGYKSGSFNLTALSGGPNQDFSFEDEEVEGGELGLKSVLFGRQLAFNLAGYFFRYKDLQVGVVTPIAAGGVPVNRTLNAGSAESYGVELDFGFRPRAIVRLQIHGAVGWNHARFRRLNNVPCWGGQNVAEGCTEGLNPQTGRFTGQNLAGEPLVRAPDWQANIGFSYDIPLNQLWTLVVSNENQYSSKYKTVLGLRDDFWQKAFFKTDWSLALTDADARWEIAAIGKNLTNELTTGNCTPSNAAAGSVFGGQNTGGTTRGPSGVDELACFMDRGRELWLRLTYNFGKGAD